MNPGIQPARPGATLSHWQRLLCVLFIFALVGGFVAAVSPVIVANPDDRDFVAAAHNPAIAQQLVGADLTIGRFYAPLKFEILNAGYAHTNPLWVSTWRAVILLAEALLIGALIATVAENEAAGWLAAVLVAAFLQLVPTYSPVVSYPQLGVGMILCLGSLLAWHRGCRTDSPGWRALAAALFAGSLLTHEFFLSLLPMHLAVGAHASGWRTVRYAWSLVVIGAVYTAAYAATAHVGRMDAYDGTQPHFAAAEAASVLVRQTVAALPGVELTLDRSAPRVLRSGASAVRLFDNDLHWPDIVAALGLISMLAILSSKVQPVRRAWSLSAIAVGFAFLPSVMIALTRKYQILSHHRIFPYTYAYYSAYFIIGAAVFGLQALRTHFRRPWAARTAIAVFALAATGVSMICRATSRDAVDQLHRYGPGFLHDFPHGVPPAIQSPSPRTFLPQVQR